MTKLGVMCYECKQFIEKGRNVYYIKHCDEMFCSKGCLQRNIVEDLDIRTKILN